MDLLQRSFTGSIFIILVFVIRLLTVEKLPKNTFLLLWSVALCRLLIPFSIPSAFSVYSLLTGRMVSRTDISEGPIGRLLPLSVEAWGVGM